MTWTRNRQMLIPISLGLALLSWLVFAQTTTFSFTNLDDNIYVAANPNLAQGLSVDGIRWAFTTHRGNIWMPMTWLSFLADQQLTGSGPSGFHRTNALLHLFNTLLLLLLLQRITGAVWRSTLVAALFAVHPLHVESVAWVAERKDVLCGFFFLLTLHLHLWYKQRRNLGLYAAVLLCFTLALMAKPMAVTLPVIIMLLDWWQEGPMMSQARRGLEILPFFTLSAVMTWVTSHLAGQAELHFIDPMPWPGRVGRAAVFYGHYLLKTILPQGLMVHYPPQNLVYPIWEMAVAVMGLGLFTALVWKLRHTARWLAFGWGGYLIMLLPVVGIFRGGYQMMSDRYLYLPAIGLFVAIVWSLASLVHFRPLLRWPVVATVATAVILLTWSSHRQAATWRNSETLYRHALAIEPENYLAQMNLGVVLDDQGRSAEALTHLLKAVALKADYLHRFNLANCLLHLNRYREAIPYYRSVLARKDDFPEAHNNLGICLASTGEFEEAAREFRRAIALQNDYAGAHYNLGLVLEQLGHSSAAQVEFQRTLELDPGHRGAQENLRDLH